MGNKIYLTDGNFDTANTANYLLFIEAGQNDYAYLVIDEHAKVKAISYNQGVLSNNIDKSLLQLSYKKTYISLHTSSFTFLPTQLYSKDNEHLYSQFIYSQNNSTIQTLTILNNQITAIHTFTNNALNTIKSLFPLAEILPQYQVTINAAYNQLANQTIPQLLLNIKLSCSEILILQNNNLLLYNIFDTDNDDEILYYTLNVCQQNNFLPTNVQIHLCGNVGLNSPVYNMLKQYFETVNFRHQTQLDLSADAFGSIIKHQFYSLFNLSTCV